MTITTKSKKEFEATIKEYRSKGFNLITLGTKFAELESGNAIVKIIR